MLERLKKIEETIDEIFPDAGLEEYREKVMQAMTNSAGVSGEEISTAVDVGHAKGMSPEEVAAELDKKAAKPIEE